MAFLDYLSVKFISKICITQSQKTNISNQKLIKSASQIKNKNNHTVKTYIEATNKNKTEEKSKTTIEINNPTI